MQIIGQINFVNLAIYINMLLKQRFYFDTSVFGGVFDKEFDEASLQLFERVRLGKVICLFSDITEDELIDAPQNVRNYFNDLPRAYMEKLEVNEDALILAHKYIDARVIGETSFDDCVHIALATIYKADILTSWNFKHIVNIYRIRGYNSVNLKNNFSTIEIRTPREIIKYEK